MRDFIYRWKTTIGIVLAVVLFVGSVAFVLSRVAETSTQNSQTLAAVVEERITSRVAECHGQAEFRTEFPATLRKIAKAASAQRGIDLTSFPEYVQLTDPRTRAYLAALEKRLNQAPPSDQPDIVTQAAIDYEKHNPIPDCKAVERKLRRELQPS